MRLRHVPPPLSDDQWKKLNAQLDALDFSTSLVHLWKQF